MKKRIMVHYLPLPTDEYGQHYSDKCFCMRWTRNRIIGFTIVVLFSFLMVFTSVIHSTSWTITNFNNTVKCMNSSRFAVGDMSKTPLCYEQGAKQTSPLYKQRFPTAIIIGARKAGTRALLQFISLHRGVAGARKETHFFDRHYEEGFEWYRMRMPFSFPSQITIEKTPNYFVDADVPERVYRFNSSIKLLLIVRNPIDRALSDYLQLRGKSELHAEHNMPFEELVVDQDTGEINMSYSPIKRSLYPRHIDKWLRYFPLAQILILDGDNIKLHPWEEIAKVEQFLGLPVAIDKSRFIYNETKGFFCIRSKAHNKTKIVSQNQSYHIDSETNIPYIERCLAKTKGREHPDIDPGVRLKLREFFEPYNRRFFERIHRVFDWH